MLKRGSSGPEVEALQRKLIAGGINPGPVDGLFGTRTEAAVRQFQERHGLQVDGIAGPDTMGALAGTADPGETVAAGTEKTENTEKTEKTDDRPTIT
jgi:peptidoglycan hydrolase-like protein with peptidoglycan-binding domain